MKRLAGKNKIDEIIQKTAEKTIFYLEKLGSSPEGMDPRKVFMNASINVTSGFAFEKNYDFEDEEFQKLAEYINEFFKGLTHKSLQQMTWNILPRWICESDFYAKIWYKTPMKHFLDAVPPFHKFIYTMIKEQRKSLDHANPRNYLETLLIDAESDPKWGYFTVVATIVGVFLGASDTLANTMTWLALVLADHPEVQEKMNNEIKAAREIDADLKKENCPFTRFVLLESRRLNSVSDTLPHIVSEDITVKGFHIPRNSQIFGSLAAVMRDPKNFDNPSKFIPDRFIKDGRFENDPKVCGFSVGLRNCIGKSLAIEEYFAFATAMVENFRIKRVAGNMDLAKHAFLRLPIDDIRVQFLRR
ncbi:unnamed protein product [Oikopleura dioica]|uniref:Uncharacterized protein n=1 Tax=Oikopleura dioica TaxID=34765 RepID=E4X220_OIKDI|nr:unnamed protein product [Oikopleura dioica]